MKELNFETGLVTYSINDKCEITLNPTDLVFTERLINTFDLLDKQQDEWAAEAEKIQDYHELFDLARKRDADMRQIIDDLFGEPVCEKVFGSMSVYALAEGAPLWSNLLFAVWDEVEASFTKEANTPNPRIEKYTKKYHK